MTMETPDKAEQRPFTGRHMLAAMLAFFGVVIAVNLTMAWLAGRTWTGLVVKNSYVASQGFNEELQQAREQGQRGWKSVLEYTQGKFEFQLTDRSGDPVFLDDLKLSIGRPAYEQQDADFSFVHLGNGRYATRITLSAGLWSLRVTGRQGERPYRRDSRIFVPDPSDKSDG